MYTRAHIQNAICMNVCMYMHTRAHTKHVIHTLTHTACHNIYIRARTHNMPYMYIDICTRAHTTCHMYVCMYIIHIRASTQNMT